MTRTAHPVEAAASGRPAEREPDASLPPAGELPLREGEMAAVRNTFVAIDRAERARALYPADHPARPAADDLLWQRVAGFLEEYGDLVLHLSEEQFLYRGRKIQKVTPAAGSLARRLFDDGIRRLTIHTGISREELIALLEILSLRIDSDDIEHDLATLLGAKGFAHVSHLLLVPEEEVAADASLAGKEWRSNPGGEGRFRGAALGMEMKEDDLRRVQASAALDTVDAHRLQQMIVEDRERDLIADYEMVLCEILLLRPESEAIENTFRAFARLFARHLASGEVDRALRVLDRLEPAGNEPMDERIAEIRERVRASCTSGECVSRLGELLDRPGADLTGPLGRLFRRIGPSALSQLFPRIRSAESVPGFRELLEEIVPACPRRLLRELRNPDPQAVLLLLELVSGHRMEEAIPPVMDLLRHPEPPIRAAAVRCLLGMGEGPARAAVRSSLRDPEETLRLAVIRVVEEDRRTDLAPDLERLARSRDFLHRKLAEKQEILRALAVLDPDAALPLLRSMLGRTSLLHRTQRDEVRAAAAFALGFLGREKAREALFRHVADRSNRVRDACHQAIRTFQNLHSTEGALAV